MTTTMIVVWAMVMALTLLLEFFTIDFFACCFSLGAVVALILAACNVSLYWQVAIFFIVTVVALCTARPLLKRLVKKTTVPTNIDQNFGKQVRLLADVVNGESSIKINDVIWKVTCEAKLKQNDEVTIERVEGNKMVVVPVAVDTTKKNIKEK
ncbi:MAG: NfeD family protein [Clostridia bacterium]|nr:NfeD family protein [Clostridia bacterium]